MEISLEIHKTILLITFYTNIFNLKFNDYTFIDFKLT